MDQLAIHRIAEAAQVDALRVDQRSKRSFVFADTARVSDRDDPAWAHRNAFCGGRKTPVR